MLKELADVQHEIWSHWMKYLFEVSIQNDDGTVTIPADKVENWKRQMVTRYADLSSKEQESDLEQAEKVMALLKNKQQTEGD